MRQPVHIGFDTGAVGSEDPVREVTRQPPLGDRLVFRQCVVHRLLGTGKQLVDNILCAHTFDSPSNPFVDEFSPTNQADILHPVDEHAGSRRQLRIALATLPIACYSPSDTVMVRPSALTRAK